MGISKNEEASERMTGESISKLFKGHMILNWKTGSMRVMKKAPKNASPFEIPLLIKIKVNIPDRQETIVEGEIDVKPEKVKEMVVHSI